MSSSSAVAALEIACAKPGCHWKGPPADAPGHACPTAAANDVAKSKDPFEGIETIAESPEPEPDEIAFDADPATRDELELWLGAHGQYDEAGRPTDEKTAALDARLSVLADAGEEPPIEEAELVEGDGVEKVGIEAPADGTPVELAAAPRPWERVIVEALEQQSGVGEYRWLVVWHPADTMVEAELVGRGKTMADANEIRDAVIAEGKLEGKVEVVKTQAVREATQEPEPPAETPLEEPEAETPPAGGALFDKSQYDREDLAIPKVDGSSIDRIAISLTGTIFLDRSDPADVKLYNGIREGKDIELRVAGRWGGTGAKPHTNREGELDVVVGTKTLKVETVWILEPEDL